MITMVNKTCRCPSTIRSRRTPGLFIVGALNHRSNNKCLPSILGLMLVPSIQQSINDIPGNREAKENPFKDSFF